MKKVLEAVSHQNETQRTLQDCGYTIKFLDLRSLSANSSRMVSVAVVEGVEMEETVSVCSRGF